jgi:hypothetical protein
LPASTSYMTNRMPVRQNTQLGQSGGVAGDLLRMTGNIGRLIQMLSESMSNTIPAGWKIPFNV